MIADDAGAPALACPVCEAPNTHVPGTSRYVECSGCGRYVGLVEPRRQWPALVATALCGIFWTAAVVPRTGLNHSAELNLIAALIALWVLRSLKKRWAAGGNSTKSLDPGIRIFAIMSLVGFVFALLSIYLHLFGGSHLGAWTVGRVVEAQAQMAEWKAATTLAAMTKWLLIGLAALAIALALLGAPEDMMRTAEVRKSVAKWLGAVAMVLICIGSFSVVTASSGSALVRVADDRIASELRALADATSQLETKARIVFGEQLAASIVDRDPPARGGGSQDVGRLFDEVVEKEEMVRRAGIEDSPPGGAHIASADFEAQLFRLADAYENARDQAPLEAADVRLGRFAALTASQVKRAAIERCGSDGCRLPSAKGWKRAQLKQVVVLVIDAALGFTGFSIPEAAVSKPLGSFAKAIVKAVANDPAKARIKRSIGDLAVRLVDSSFDPAQAVLPSPPPRRAAVQRLRVALTQRLGGLSAQLQRASAPAAVEIAATEADMSTTQSDVSTRADTAAAPTEEIYRRVVASNVGVPAGSRASPVAADATVGGAAPARDPSAICVCHITYLRNGVVVGSLDRPQSCAAPCP